ncbi:hypothetical protein [Xanthomonas sp. 1678]|uniref:hypothetical protein n=1 Tax=Xanthomonas sp. 1678 TaxID=3158788 RepID=UPI0028660FCD|nr:uncharacterized membrane protein YhaH (DUF805 family) [Xanthomonas translucens]
MEDPIEQCERRSGQLVVIAIALFLSGLLFLVSLILAFRSQSLWAVLFVPIGPPAVLIAVAMMARHRTHRLDS